MHPVVRVIGKVLRLVGISSPEDALPKPKDASNPPSWRTTMKESASRLKDLPDSFLEQLFWYYQFKNSYDWP
jgi:hypothetical protein